MLFFPVLSYPVLLPLLELYVLFPGMQQVARSDRKALRVSTSGRWRSLASDASSRMGACVACYNSVTLISNTSSTARMDRMLIRKKEKT